jgi:hypothetical protein
MADTTSINDLPENVTMSVHPSPSISLPPILPPNGSQQQQQPQQQGSMPPLPPSIDPNVINQLVSGLQHASASGATRLKSSDIPMDSLPLTADPNVQQHHVPHHPSYQGQTPHHNQSPYQNHEEDYPNYIQEEDNMDDIIMRNRKRTAYNNQMEMWIDEFQVPLMVAIMYFLFQLPIVRKMLHEYLPFLYYLDGNMNINGYILVSVFFGVLYYVLCKIIN